MASLASLFVDIRGNAAPLERTLGGVRGQLVQTDSSLRRTSGLGSQLFAGLGTQALMGGLRAGLGLVESLGAGLFRGITGAANLTESISKAGEVFGPSAVKITALADLMAEKFGLSKQTIIDAASNIGLIGEAAGMNQGKAADLGVEMAQLAADAMSFYNIPLDVALEKIRSGLVGESEPMRELGVLLTETAVKNEALRMGLASSAKGVDEQDKVLARSSLIRSGLAKATGDLARTAASPSNRMRAIGGRAENFMADVGGALMPAFEAGLSITEGALGSIGAFFTANKETVKGWAVGIGADITAAGATLRAFFTSLGELATGPAASSLVANVGGAFTWLRTTVQESVATISTIYHNWDALTQITGLQIFQSLADIPAVFSWLVDSATAFGIWLGTNWRSLIVDAFTAVLGIAKNFADVFMGMFGEIGKVISDPTKILETDWSKFNPVENFRKMIDLSKAEFTTPGLELPALKLDHTETDRQIGELMSGIVDETLTRTTGPGAEALTPAGAAARRGLPGAAGPGLAGAAEKEVKPRTEGLEAFAKRLQEGAFGKEDVGKKQLTAQERMAGGIDKLVALTTPKQAGDTAVFAS